jgi:hypothetical protein
VSPHEIMSDRPAERFRFQVTEPWEQATEAHRTAMAKAIREVLRRYGVVSWGRLNFLPPSTKEQHMRPLVIASAAYGQHLVRGVPGPVPGYLWFYLTLPAPGTLFVPDGTSRLRVEARNGEIVRVEGGELTESGRAFYEALSVGSPQLWTDAPEDYVRLQVTDPWEAATWAQHEALRSGAQQALTEFGCSEFTADRPAKF